MNAKSEQALRVKLITLGALNFEKTVQAISYLYFKYEKTFSNILNNNSRIAAQINLKFETNN